MGLLWGFIFIIIIIVTACEESAFSFTAAILRLGKKLTGKTLAPLAVQALTQEELDADTPQLKPEQLCVSVEFFPLLESH